MTSSRATRESPPGGDGGERKWLAEVYRGGARQLTVRAALSGMLLGALMCLSNLYVVLKTGAGIEGHGFTFTIGRGNEICAEAIRAFSPLVIGRTLADVPKQKTDGDGFIGATEFYRVHLHYKAEKKWLASNDAALTEPLVEKMLAANKEKKRLLVFAAAKFMSQKELTRQGVEFCQLPYAIHRILGD